MRMLRITSASSADKPGNKRRNKAACLSDKYFLTGL